MNTNIKFNEPMMYINSGTALIRIVKKTHSYNASYLKTTKHITSYEALN